MSKHSLSLDDVKKVFSIRGFTALSTYKKGKRRFVDYICDKGHSNSMPYIAFRDGNGCSICAGRKKLTIDFVKEKFLEQGFTITSETYRDNKQKLDCICPEGHQFRISYDKFFNHGKRCKTCYINSRKLKIDQVVKKLGKEGYILLSNDVPDSKCVVTIKCPNGHITTTRWQNYSAGHRCSKCSFLDVKQESDLEKILISLDVGDVIRNTKRIISPYEIDLYLPEQKIAIEMCGLYWHTVSNRGKDEQYHKRKYEMCREKGIKLITVLEQEYRERTNQFISYLLRFVNRNNNVYSGDVGKVDINVANDFVIDNEFIYHKTNVYYPFCVFSSNGEISRLLFLYKKYNKWFMSAPINKNDGIMVDDLSFITLFFRYLKENSFNHPLYYKADFRLDSQIDSFLNSDYFKVSSILEHKAHLVDKRYKHFVRNKKYGVDTFYDCGGAIYNITF